MTLVVGLCCVAVGACSALAIWFPRLRRNWDRRSKVAQGPVSNAGIALFTISMGIFFLSGAALSHLAPPIYRTIGAFSALTGQALIGVGYGLDLGASPNPRHHDWSRWWFAWWGVGFLILAGSAVIMSPN